MATERPQFPREIPVSLSLQRRAAHGVSRSQALRRRVYERRLSGVSAAPGHYREILVANKMTTKARFELLVVVTNRFSFGTSALGLREHGHIIKGAFGV